MKKLFISTAFIITVFTVISFAPFYVDTTLAQTPTATTEEPYNLLAPIPCVGGDCSGQLARETTLPQYIKGFIQLSIGISAVFAIVMIVIGGFQYMTSDALQGKQDGKTRIKNSVIGILLIAASFIILQTINPDLLNINLNIDASPTSVSGTQTGTLVAGGTCTTCVPLDSSLRLGDNTNTQIYPETGAKLLVLNESLKEASIGWAITEAYPPKVTHKNPCHSAGTCVDANFRNTAATAQNINKFIEATSGVGLKAIYEVKTPKEKSDLVSAGVPSNSIMVIEEITGSHFSVYNCSAHPESCRTLP
jgi:hypothetical protein